MFGFSKRNQSPPPQNDTRANLRTRLGVEALESREVPASYVVDTPLDLVEADGLTSLREAILAANGEAAGVQHLITFAPGINGQTISLNAQLTLEKNIYIAGPGATALTVQRNTAAGDFRLFEVAATSDSIIAGMKLRGGKVTGANGGAILVSGGATVTGCIIRDSIASVGGGIATAVRGDGGKSSLTVYDTLITNNTAGVGGGIGVSDGDLTASNGVEISWNTGSYAGGGVYIKKQDATTAPQVSFSSVVVSYNTGGHQGGGIVCFEGSLTITGGSIYSNVATVTGAVTRGGGIYLGANGILSAVNNPLISNNTASLGDGLYIKIGGVKTGTFFYVDDSEYDENPA